MATIVRGTKDNWIRKMKKALDAYEADHPGAVATLYRQGVASIRVRIVDKRFKGKLKYERHDQVWGYLTERIDDETRAEMSVLLLLTPDELATSLMNQEFDDPIPSVL